jgi:hypothetical protein
MNKQKQAAIDDRIHTAISIIRGYLHDHKDRHGEPLKLRGEEALVWAQNTSQRLGYEGIKHFVDVPLPTLEEMVRMAVERSKQNQEKQQNENDSAAICL